MRRKGHSQDRATFSNHLKSLQTASSEVCCHFRFIPRVPCHIFTEHPLPLSPGSGIMTDETDGKRCRRSLTATAVSVIAAISLMRLDDVRAPVCSSVSKPGAEHVSCSRGLDEHLCHSVFLHEEKTQRKTTSSDTPPLLCVPSNAVQFGGEASPAEC